LSAKGMRRLEILLPESHPLFGHPDRWRAKVAREWLDLGARLSAVEQELRHLEIQMAGIQGQARMEIAGPSGDNEAPSAGFATGSFTKALTDAFG